MPIKDWGLYPKNWKTVIRPDILKRANNRCEFCKVENYEYAFRGFLSCGKEVYQLSNGNIYDAKTGEFLIQSFDVYISPSTGNENQKAVKIVLTIAHLNHVTTDNEYSNLRALCQKCHLNYDKEHHAKNLKATIRAKKNIIEMDFKD
mgnify:FL=1